MMENHNGQNLTMGIIGGLGAALIGAVIWAVITVVTEYQIGWMAVGVGFLVGYAVRMLGNGSDKIFAISGGTIALFGCLIGNLLTVAILVSRQEHVGILSVLSRLTPGIAIEVLKETFQPMDALFYGIAVYEGYKFSIKVPAEETTGNSEAVQTR